MRIKATDTDGKTHWFVERQNGTFVWGEESHATHMPLAAAMKWAQELDSRNRYLEENDRMEIRIDRSFQ